MIMPTFSRILVAAVLLLFSNTAFSGDVKKGMDAYESNDYATALTEWQELADAGNAEAAYGMGLLYGNGMGVEMNDDLALKYYGIAAEQGHPDAAFSLAVMHQNGWGVPMDEIKANEWYRVAAEKGNTEAQMALGRYFAMDFSDSYDPVEAYKWFSLAERLGDIGASEKRDFTASRMTPEQVIEGNSQVDVWIDGHKTLLAND